MGRPVTVVGGIPARDQAALASRRPDAYAPTRQPVATSGTVTDARGGASTTSVVLAFPTDRQRWSGYGASPRNLKSTLSTRTGVYTFEHLPAGDYYVIAVEPADADGWQDPARLEALAPQATRLSIASSDALKTLDLRVRSIR